MSRLRIPLVRFGKDDTAIAPWEWVFAPVMLPVLLVVLLVGTALRIPYRWLYPERHMGDSDLGQGTPEVQARVRAFCEYRGGVSLWCRLLEKACLRTFDAGPTGRQF